MALTSGIHVGSYQILGPIGAALAFSFARTQPEVAPQVSKLAAPLPAPMLDTGRPVIALSPDGGRIGYVAVHGSTSIIYVRPVDGFDAMALPGTEGAISLFYILRVRH